jgi:hypothetical protein
LKSEEEVFNGDAALKGKENTVFGGFFIQKEDLEGITRLTEGSFEQR